MGNHPQSQETAIQLPDAKYILAVLIFKAMHSCYSYKTESLLYLDSKCPLNHEAPFLHLANTRYIFFPQSKISLLKNRYI